MIPHHVTTIEDGGGYGDYYNHSSFASAIEVPSPGALNVNVWTAMCSPLAYFQHSTLRVSFTLGSMS